MIEKDDKFFISICLIACLIVFMLVNFFLIYQEPCVCVCNESSMSALPSVRNHPLYYFIIDSEIRSRVKGGAFSGTE